MTTHEEMDEPVVKRIAFAPMDQTDVEKTAARGHTQVEKYRSTRQILMSHDRIKDLLRTGPVLVSRAMFVAATSIVYQMVVDREIRKTQHEEMMMVLNQLQTAANFQAREMDKLRRSGQSSGGPV